MYSVFYLVDDEEDEVLVSGWGEVDNSAFRDDVMTEWGSLLEKWDGRDKSRPKQLIKLCRQVRISFMYTFLL